MKSIGLFLIGLAVASALPREDPIVRKLTGDDEPRYQYVRGPDGTPHLVDLWLKASDVASALRFDPDRTNTYHLWTQANPTVSQPLVFNSNALLANSSYDASKPTIVLLHGWLEDVTSNFVATLVPAILGAKDVNLIAVDWSAGANNLIYATAVLNNGDSGRAVGRFINWVTQQTNGSVSDWSVFGIGLGGHQAGVVGRYVGQQIAYINSMDPSLAGFTINDDKLRANDAKYTEVIHTNVGLLGYIGTLGHTDFYPNGGVSMPGCLTEACDHARSYFYFAESISRGGFTSNRCSGYVTAMANACFLWGTEKMGGLTPKTGKTGVFRCDTNATPPFSRS